MVRRRVLWLTGLLALGGLLVAAPAAAVADTTAGPNVAPTASGPNISDATPGNATEPVDGDDGDVSGDDPETDDGSESSVVSDPVGSSDEDSTDGETSDGPLASVSDGPDGSVSANVGDADRSLNATSPDVSVRGVASIVEPVARVLDELPEDDGAGAARQEPGGVGHDRATRERSTATDTGGVDAATADGRGHEDPSASGSASDSARTGRAAPVAIGASERGEPRGAGDGAPPGVGLAAVLVGLLALQAPAGSLALTAEAVGRTGYWVGRGRAGRFGDRVLPIGPVPGYSRYDSSDPLENDTRAAIYEAVRESPGIYFAKLADVTGVAEETVRYHGRILEEEGLVEQREVRGRRRLYPLEVDGDRRLAAALEEPAAADVIAAIERHEPASLSGLADALDRAPSTMSHHIDRLEADGLVVRERDGDALQVRLQPSVRSELTPDALAD